MLNTPVTFPPVIWALPELNKFACSELTDKFVIPVMLPLVICALAVEKFVATKVVTDASVKLRVYPPVI